MAFRGCRSFARATYSRGASRPSRALLVGILALAAGPSVANADVSKAECIDANAKAQDARREGRFSDARLLLLQCAVTACPDLVRDDCTRRFDELEKAQPTIVFDTKDASGRDVIAVKVTVDGKPLAERVVGLPLAVDPGEHTFTFTESGLPPVTQTFAIKEGVKNRHEVIVLGGSAPTTPQAAPVPPSAPALSAAPPPPAAMESGPPTPPPPSTEKPAVSGIPWRTVGWVLGGVGLAGIGVGTVFGLEALSTKSQHCDANGTCTPAGTAAKAYQQATVSTTGLVAGGVLLAGGLGLVVLAPGGERTSTTGVAIGPLAGPSTAGACVSGRW
jgi:hypothetical protein